MAECIETVQYMFDCMYPLNSENDKDLRDKQLELEWNRKDEAPPKPLDPFNQQIQDKLSRGEETPSEAEVQQEGYAMPASQEECKIERLALNECVQNYKNGT